MSVLMPTSPVSEGAGAEEATGMTVLLAQFNRLTEQMREAVLQEDYRRVDTVLGERGVIAGRLQEYLKGGAEATAVGTEGHQRRRELIIEVHAASQRLADAINEKSSELIERLVGIHNMKSSQVYTSQGAGHGYRQGNK